MQHTAMSGAMALMAAAAITLPAAARAQARVIADPKPPHSQESRFGGARLMRSGVASQFDTLGVAPLGHIGDSVTQYLFTYNDKLSRVLHSRITSRQRFLPPVSWRAACDEIAHPGWFFNLSPSGTALFAVVVPGSFGRPNIKEATATSRSGAWQYFHALADSAWHVYLDYRKPADERAVNYMHADFWGPDGDARYAKLQMYAVRGPEGRGYTAFSFAFRDDRPDLPNTTRTWIVDSWGFLVASAIGNVDIYGTVDDNGVDAVVTSSGLIRWSGTEWQIPPVYSEEPCLYHRTMPVPAGARP